mgnify:CR=1 FL=1
MSALTSILAAELIKIEETAAMDRELQKQRLTHHLMPPTGWLNDPNGLCYFKGRYHVFFQYSPFDAEGGLKLWGHYSSEDLVSWRYEGVPLYPDSSYDCHGVYSGSAIVEDEKLHLFFTGNVKMDGDYDHINNGREASTLHVESEDGIHFGVKEVAVDYQDYPETYTRHVRDPKVWKDDDAYFMALGGRKKNDQGAVLIYRSENLKNWTYEREITTEEPFGYMWECPDLFEMDGQLYIICCPQGVETQGIDYENVHQVTAMKLDYDFDTDEYEITDIKLFDRGFDFYAPQSFEDESGRRILIGWMGIPDADYTNPTEEAGWQHALTIPRELSVRDGKLIQEPIEELKQLRSEDKAVCTFCYGQTIIMQNAIYEAVVDFKRCREMVMTLREGITLSYKDNILTLNLGVYGSGRSTRKVRLEKLEHLQIFADTSSLEIFVNHGEEVFTTRIYNHYGRLLINGECSGIMTVYPLKSFEIEGGRHEE